MIHPKSQIVKAFFQTPLPTLSIFYSLTEPFDVIDVQLIYNTLTICISQREDRNVANVFSPLRYVHYNFDMFFF